MLFFYLTPSFATLKSSIILQPHLKYAMQTFLQKRVLRSTYYPQSGLNTSNTRMPRSPKTPCLRETWFAQSVCARLFGWVRVMRAGACVGSPVRARGGLCFAAQAWSGRLSHPVPVFFKALSIGLCGDDIPCRWITVHVSYLADAIFYSLCFPGWPNSGGPFARPPGLYTFLLGHEKVALSNSEITITTDNM